MNLKVPALKEEGACEAEPVVVVPVVRNVPVAVSRARVRGIVVPTPAVIFLSLRERSKVRVGLIFLIPAKSSL